MTDDVTETARARFAAGEYEAAYRDAVQALGSAPDDLELLLIAGRAASEIDADDAVTHLRRATEVASGDARAWSALGEALLTEGDTDGADAAFRKAVDIDPDDHVALTHLGHTSSALGRGQEGVGYLTRAADGRVGSSTAAISLIDMYRSFGQLDEALTHATRLAEAAPEDVMAWLDVAELSIETGKLDDARSAFETLRDLDDVPGHEAYPLHGLLRVAIAEEAWDGALELIGQAKTIDGHGLTTDVEAFLNHQTGSADEDAAAPPDRETVEAALDASLAEYRRMHADDRRANAGQILG